MSLVRIQKRRAKRIRKPATSRAATISIRKGVGYVAFNEEASKKLEGVAYVDILMDHDERLIFFDPTEEPEEGFSHEVVRDTSGRGKCFRIAAKPILDQEGIDYSVSRRFPLIEGEDGMIGFSLKECKWTGRERRRV